MAQPPADVGRIPACVSASVPLLTTHHGKVSATCGKARNGTSPSPAKYFLDNEFLNETVLLDVVDLI